MARFRSRPSEIEAVQWSPSLHHSGVHFEDRRDFGQEPRPYVVTMYEQKAYLVDGDWIVYEPIANRYYPIKPDVFAKKYEAIT